MESEAVSMAVELISKFGTPTVLVVLLVVMAYKYVPKLLDMWMKKQEAEHDYLNKQREQYDADRAMMIKQMEMSTQVIERNTAAFERNNSNSERSADANEQAAALLAKIDRRTEHMNVDIVKIAGKPGIEDVKLEMED